MMAQLSSEKDLEDFLRRCTRSPLRVQLEWQPTAPAIAAREAYQRQTEQLTAALRSGRPDDVAFFLLGRAAA